MRLEFVTGSHPLVEMKRSQEAAVQRRRRQPCPVASSKLFMFLLTLLSLSICISRPLIVLADLSNNDGQDGHSHQANSHSDHQVIERDLTTRAISQPEDADFVSLHQNSTLANLKLKHLSNLPVIHQQPASKSILINTRKYTVLGNNNRGPLFYSFPPTTPITTSAASTMIHQQQQQQQHHQKQTHHQAIRQHEQLANSHQTPKAGLLEKICMGTSNKVASHYNKSDHYQSLYERYKDCTYVIGNLEITWLDKTSSGIKQQEADLDLSFLESIREITGYLLIAHVNVTRIRMPNLQIIRGRDLFKSYAINEKEEFALMLIENDLEFLELPNLAEIQAGSVGSYDNRNLCRIRTIDWDEILSGKFKSIFVYNGAQPECPPCDPVCNGRCWGEGPEMCQKFSKITCASACGGGRCFGATSSDCCHQFCAAGCTGPNQTDCLACKTFYDNGSCVQDCPSLQRYDPSTFTLLPNPHGKYAFGATCVKDCPDNMLRDSGACVRSCPPNKRSQNGECVSCNPCPKKCQEVDVVHSGNIDQLINCTVIDGSITILDQSFTGGHLVQTETGVLKLQSSQHDQHQVSHQQQQHQQSAQTNQNSSSAGTTLLPIGPMHPSRLEAFKTLREITGYLVIKAKHPDFKDLSFLSELRSIGESKTNDLHQALSITRTSLVSLNLRSLRRITKGKILIEENPELCFAETIDWNQLEIGRNRGDDVTIRNNAEPNKCRAANLQCHEQCARDGCWGPGPDECLSCNNYKLDQYCVANCSSTKSLGFLSYEESAKDRICKRCHAECSEGCDGTEARHCHACRSVKDGPYCVPECPSHKYNSNGTCLECDKGCGPDGCSGPSNKLGEGGCNSCAKAIIRSHHDPALAQISSITGNEPSFDIECIKSEEPCPDGYYQEYVAGASQPEGSPLKSSSGRPVCRKCHHRCKRCIGMGTHKTVCECAKYVAGEQCEDLCPRDYYADDNSRQCVKCSPECNGCFGPTEADCISCRVYRIYYDSGQLTSSHQQQSQQIGGGGPVAAAQVLLGDSGVPGSSGQSRLRFNCTAQCPSDKPHRISESNMLDPYCSDDPGIDPETTPIVALSSTSILFLFIISSALMICISIYRCQIERDKTYKMTMRLSGIEDVEPLTPSHMKPNLAPLRSIKESELSEGKVLGSGFGGTVHQGFWRPEGKEFKHAIPVAIKKLRDNGQSNINKEFLEEAYIMASVDHPNLVRLLAVCMTPKNLMLVTQLMPLGCLLDYVKKNKQIIGSKNLLEWGKQIARGMEYLEERRMVHRDLALRNVLLQTPRKALISDFGLAKFLEVDQSEYHSGGGRLPIKWLAPECIRERKFTHQSDVWAFGVTIWELVTFGQRPFEEYETRDVPLAIEKGARLQQPSNVTAELYMVMLACWLYTPNDRPKFRQLVQSFAKFARDPERYLICGSKGIELCKGMSMGRHLDDNEGNEEQCDDQYDMDESGDADGDESPSEEVSPTSLASSQPPLGSAMPNLTPSTHNRLNEMFGFELQRHRASESSDLNGPSSSLTTPILKKIGMFSGGSRQLNHTANNHQQQSRHHHHHHQHPHLSSSNLKNSLITTDANNNTTFVANANNGNNSGCWSMHHTVSSNSLGQRSEQPTDMYDYLLPSPSTNEHGNTFSTFYTNSYDNSDTLSVRNPPHSAGVVSNITNQEYFLTRANYVNETHQGRSLSTSNGNIPQSLV